MCLRLGLLLAIVIVIATSTLAQTRLEKVLADREKFVDEGTWIYQDLPAATKAAKESDKPLMVVLRCIPCEECVKLDDDVFEEDDAIKPLIDKFVRARIVSTNGLDLATFQFDTDNSWMVFFLNADGTVYGRFGTRSDRTEWKDDVSVAGLAKAMAGALRLHEDYPANKRLLAGKRGPQPRFATPEQYPLLKPKYESKITFNNNVVKSCIHCHQIGDAERLTYREAGKPIPQETLYPYPHPKALGLILDPTERATVKRVEADSSAEKAHLHSGDQIVSFGGQPMLSIADFQWVLHNTPATGGTINVLLLRDGQPAATRLQLADRWRQRDDITWRVSSWPLRRMAAGGLKLEPLAAERRTQLKFAEEKMALLVKHVGQYGPHAAAKQAGFREGDILISFDGRDDLLREGDLLAYAVNAHQAGERVNVGIIRGEKRMSLTLPMQP